MKTQPYLMFQGRTEEALQYYQRTLGAKIIDMKRFKDNPEPAYNPKDSDDKIMHATFQVGDDILMASDGDCSGQANFKGFSLSLTVDSVAEADRVFAALADGGTVQMPLSKTFWSPRFGMLADRFGLPWMVNVWEK